MMKWSLHSDNFTPRWMHAGASKYRTNDKKMRELDVKSIKAEALGKSKVCYCARICCHFIHSNNRLAYIYTIESEIKTLRLGHPVIAREISDVRSRWFNTLLSIATCHCLSTTPTFGAAAAHVITKSQGDRRQMKKTCYVGLPKTTGMLDEKFR